MEESCFDLTGRILIATPYVMADNIFFKSLIYVIEHNKNGAVGLIFNQPTSKPPTDKILNKVGRTISRDLPDLPTYVGGPLDNDRMFFLHSTDYKDNLLMHDEDNSIAVSSNYKILDELENGQGPKHHICILGYTGWLPGQLEFEIENNLWIISDQSADIIFNNYNAEKKWKNALIKNGVSVDGFMPGMAYC